MISKLIKTKHCSTFMAAAAAAASPSEEGDRSAMGSSGYPLPSLFLPRGMSSDWWSKFQSLHGQNCTWVEQREA
eukprot:c26974_g1_i4 orf=2-220(-)